MMTNHGLVKGETSNLLFRCSHVSSTSGGLLAEDWPCDFDIACVQTKIRLEASFVIKALYEKRYVAFAILTKLVLSSRQSF